MTSAKQDSATFNMTCLLREWDRAPREKRRTLLQDFIDSHVNLSGPEIELELAQMASLFLSRICVWVKLTYMTGKCLTEQLQVLHIFLSAASSHHFLAEFLQNGGILCLQELCVFENAKEIDKYWALKVLSCVANGGTRYKETICECYGIRAVAECMAKSRSEQTQQAARDVLEQLAEGNPKFREQVYKGLIAVLPCNSAKAQQLALQSIRNLQVGRKTANRALIERIICILESLHLEVQSAVLELIRGLMFADIAEDIMKALVSLLHPQREIELGKMFTETQKQVETSSDSDDDELETEFRQSHDPSSMTQSYDGPMVARPSTMRSTRKSTTTMRKMQSRGSRKSAYASAHTHSILKRRSKSPRGHLSITEGKKLKKKILKEEEKEVLPLPAFVQQAAAAKSIRVLMEDSVCLTKTLLEMGALTGLLYSMGNLEFTDSQRQASLAIKFLCEKYKSIKVIVSHIMGTVFYNDFKKDTDSFYLYMTPLQADLLVSNKLKLTNVKKLLGL